MKTYWLESKEGRTPFKNALNFDLITQPVNEERRTYSPITMQQVASQSQENSPARRLGNQRASCPAIIPSREI